jgi:hypothetical protein
MPLFMLIGKFMLTNLYKYSNVINKIKFDEPGGNNGTFGSI